ncbi:MAG: class I SAM-dependent methyltransferase [Planctomycetota bacterium]|jgi:SAM-dependent methyltransferase
MRTKLSLARDNDVVMLLGLAALLLPSCVGQRENGGAKMFSESEAYERFMGRWSRQLAPEFLEFSGWGHSETVLDVGSGTGALAAALLAKSPGSTVVGVDPSAEYIRYATRQVNNDRATFEVGDGQALRFGDDSFDRTLSLLVVNFIPDAEKAVAEMSRVTKPTGVVAAAVWDYDEGMEMLRVFWDEAVLLNPAAEPRDERHMPYCRADELRDLWLGAGLEDVKVEALSTPMRFASFDDFWLPFLEGQGPAGAYVASLAEDDRTRLGERLRNRLVNDDTGQITLAARAWAVRGLAPRRD